MEESERERERENEEVDCVAAVQAANRPLILPTLSREGSGGAPVGENAGRPCPSPKRLRLGPAAATVA